MIKGVGFKSWLCIPKGVKNYHRRPVACTRYFQRGSAKRTRKFDTPLNQNQGGGVRFRECIIDHRKGCRKMDTRARGWIHPILQAFAVGYDIKGRVVVLFYKIVTKKN